MQTITPFDTSRHHIHLQLLLVDESGQTWDLDAILDTGAPRTELNATFLRMVGLWSGAEDAGPGGSLETRKLDRVVLPQVEVCGQTMTNLEANVSEFAPSWGVAALVGLDFFRRFQVTIDYDHGRLVAG